MKKKIALILIVLLSFGLISCSGQSDSVDYADQAHWLSLPASADKAVDVFYLYGTMYQKADDSDPNICGIDNAQMVQGAGLAFDRQAAAFETVGNIYAPYYRQADAGYTLSLPEDEKDKLLQGTPKEDVFAAFDYYIQHYNNGRPFILAGHSQGSNILIYLLSQYMKDNPEVYDRMIAAYIIGYSVTDEYLQENPHLKFAEGADDTGVIISYNTEAPTVEGNNPVILDGALVINPITWTRDETPALAEQNAGSIMLNSDGSVVLDENGNYERVMDYADATVDLEKCALICSTADVDTLAPGNAVFGRGVFHSFDYPFYFYNLRENAAARAANYMSSH